MTTVNDKGFIEALKGVVGDVVVGDDAAARHVDGVSPGVVVYPADLQRLSQVVELSHRWGKAVAPWGGGTQIALGNSPERLDVVVDLSRFNRVLQHNPADLTATVQAGITLDQFQHTLGMHRQFLALDPPLPHRATVGGTLATGVNGPTRRQYGNPTDLVIGMKVVQADGRVTKSGGQVVKNVSGYEMAKLHIGGLGTLGIIAEVSFRLTPLPAEEATVVAAYDSAGQCLKAALSIFHGDVVPLALTAFDGTANEGMHAVHLQGSWYLAVRLGGRPLTLQRQIRECRDTCQQNGSSQVEVLREADGEGVWRNLADFGWDERTTPVIGARATLLPTCVLELVETFGRSTSPGDLQPAVVSHPAHGTVLVQWSPDRQGLSIDDLTRSLRKVVEAVHRLGGKIVIERCPPDVKSRFDIWDEVGETLAIMRRLKEQYDPKRVLNPGRFVGGI